MSLAVAGRPTNLHLPPEAEAIPVDSDLYEICERIKEISRDLYILLTIYPDGGQTYVIMEKCKDGVDRLCYRVKELDGRVLDKLRWMLHMPLDERLAKLEAEEYKIEEERIDQEHEELYERVGGPMWHDLEKCGFIQRPVSYPKRGVKATK